MERPEGPGPGAAPPDAARRRLALVAGDSVVADTAALSLAAAATPPATAPGVESADVDAAAAAPSAEALRARQEAYAARSRQDRERVKRVNEYAFWCVEQGLWEEARIHLEQAVTRDSLAASLHNNLGILYERQGERQRALSEYALAAALAPDKRLYRTNLNRLRRAPERPPVPVDSLEVDDLRPFEVEPDSTDLPVRNPRRKESSLALP